MTKMYLVTFVLLYTIYIPYIFLALFDDCFHLRTTHWKIIAKMENLHLHP